MAVPTILLLLTALCGPAAADAAAGDFCIEQPESLHVRVGESVTIPCTFSYPKELDPAKVVQVSWRLTTGVRCGDSEFIYNHTSPKFTDQRYTGRLALVGNPGKRSGAIRIDNITKSDTNGKYCCRITIEDRDNTPERWQNRHATQLVLPDKPPSLVNQLDAIPARVGASVTIPCGFRNSEKLDLSKDVKVAWKAGRKDLCEEITTTIYNQSNDHTDGEYRGRVTLVTDPKGNGTSSLHITGLTVKDSTRYCCRVWVKDKWISSSHGTELVVGDLKPITGYTVTQPEVIEAQQDSFTVSCTFTYPQGKDPLWIGVYWADGAEWDKIINYTSQESTNLGLQLNSTLSLPVNSVADIGTESIYCLVVFRFCSGINGFTSVIQRGAGTRLVMKANGLTNIIIGIAAICAFLLIVILTVLCLKKKGLICKGSKAVKNVAASPAEVQFETLTDDPKNSQNPVNSDVSQVSKEQKVEDGLLYAALNLENATNKNSRAQALPPEETVYSAVRMK